MERARKRLSERQVKRERAREIEGENEFAELFFFNRTEVQGGEGRNGWSFAMLLQVRGGGIRE